MKRRKELSINSLSILHWLCLLLPVLDFLSILSCILYCILVDHILMGLWL